MSISGRGLIAPSFADFLRREDVFTQIQANVQKVRAADADQRYSKLTRIFDGLPQHPSTIPILIACESAIVSGEKPNRLPSSEGLPDGSAITPTLSDECNTWLHYAFASAVYELFDAHGDLRRDIKNYFDNFNLGFSDEDLKKGLLSAYMEDIIGSHVAVLAGSRMKEGCKPLFTDQIGFCSAAIQTKLQELLKQANINFNAMLKELNDYLFLKYRKNAIESKFLKAEVRRVMYSSFYHLTWSAFYTARTQYIVHLANITPAEKEAKQKVLDEVDDIANSLQNDPMRTQLEKLSILTRVLEQTQAYTPQASEGTQKKYSRLIAKVSEHAWGKRLGAAMSAVPIAALVATCILFSVATGGAAIPFLVTLSFAAMLGISIATGASAIGGLLAVGYLAWQGFKHKPIADAMKSVRDTPAPRRGVMRTD